MARRGDAAAMLALDRFCGTTATLRERRGGDLLALPFRAILGLGVTMDIAAIHLRGSIWRPGGRRGPTPGGTGAAARAGVDALIAVIVMVEHLTVAPMYG